MSVRLATQKGDTILALDRIHSPELDVFFVTFTHLGDALPYWAFSILLLFVRVRYALTTALLGISTLPVTGSLKAAFGHPRPYTWFGEADLLHLLTPVERITLYDAFNSFPSGHTLAAFTLFTFLALIAPRIWQQVACITIAVFVGISRMYLHFHFLEDVLFGALCGTVLAVAGYSLQDRYLRPLQKLDRPLFNLRR